MFYITQKRIFLFFVIAICFATLIIRPNATGRYALWLAQPFLWTGGAVQGLYISTANSIQTTSHIYLNLVQVNKENQTLKQENQHLQTKILLSKELLIENTRLLELLSMKQRIPMQLLTARIIAQDFAGSQQQTVTIDRGSRHGVTKYMAVISPSGVAGFTVNVTPLTSTVLLITDRYAVIDSIIQSSRVRALVEGAGYTIQINDLSSTHPVKLGDKVVTSGLKNIFPKGLPVGEIIEITEDVYASSQTLSIQTAVDLSTLEEVFLVLGPNSPLPEKSKTDE